MMDRTNCLVIIAMTLLLMPIMAVEAQVRKEHSPVKFRKPVDSIMTITYKMVDDQLVPSITDKHYYNSDQLLSRAIRSWVTNGDTSLYQIDYTYKNGHLAKTISNSTGETVYDFDEKGRPATYGSKNMGSYQVEYDKNGRIHRLTQNAIMSKDTITYSYHDGWYKTVKTADGVMSGRRVVKKASYYYGEKLYATISAYDSLLTIYSDGRRLEQKNADYDTTTQWIEQDLKTTSKMAKQPNDPFIHFIRETSEFTLKSKRITAPKGDWTMYYHLFGSDLKGPLREFKFRRIYYSDGTTAGDTSADVSWVSTLPTTLKQE
ncbi:hypothetical protein [Nonlabens xiamenensis]|uniref:hypothetical protein n=1 Tax=Nonlabens xiamenensis TaxID=2341043 RepID=UPI000F60FE2E|nr:hypothetical protein [Nonlabens xiamenensis]